MSEAQSSTRSISSVRARPARFATLRRDFPLLANNPSLHYLDSAATSQKPIAVLDAITNFYSTRNANPHRGAYKLSADATEAYHDARQLIAGFFGQPDDDCLIFTRGTTESINLVASAWGQSGVGADDEIVVTAMEHHANFVPWQQLALNRGAALRICELTPEGRLDLDHLASLLSDRTRVVAFTHVSNATGAINPVAAISSLVRDRTAAILVCDGAQSAPHMAVEFPSLGVDFYAFSGHKMLGPMGAGGLIGVRSILERMDPWQMGGDMIEFVLDERTTWNVLPHKFEAGTPSAGDVAGLAAAVRYLSQLGMDGVRAHELELLEGAQRRIEAIEGVTVFGPPAAERSGVLSFNLEGVHPHDLATILDSGNVCIRAGHHCAQPLMRRLGQAATARASFYVYSDESDIDALVDGVERARHLFR
jgi:cysteine desulfurase/selenocysteine lyase